MPALIFTILPEAPEALQFEGSHLEEGNFSRAEWSLPNLRYC
jgi:hypothetical protein